VIKRVHLIADHSLPTTAEVKNKWSYTPNPLHAFTAWIRTTLLHKIGTIFSCVGDRSTGCLAESVTRIATDDSVPRVSGKRGTAGRSVDMTQ